MTETVHRTKQRIEWVDYAKAITIILVVLLHSTSEEYNYTPITEFNSLLGSFRIPFFFFIAGLFIHKSLHSELKVFLKSKVAHFLYLYILWSIIKYFVDTIPRYFIYDNEVGLDGILYIFINPPSTLWFIYALLIFFIVARITRKFPIVIFFISLLLYALSVQIGNDLFLDRLARFLPFFLLGSLLSKKVIYYAKSIKLHHVIIPILFFTLAIFVQGMNWTETVIGTFSLSALGIISGIVIASLMTKSHYFNFLSFIGKKTIIIYVLHFFPLNIMKFVLPKLMSNLPSLSVIITLFFGITVPLAIGHIAKEFNVYWLFNLPSFIKRETNNTNNTERSSI